MVLKRANKYYYRWQIPVEFRDLLGQRELKRSLHTSHKLLAYRKALELDAIVQDIKSAFVAHKLEKLTQELFIKGVYDFVAEGFFYVSQSG